MRIALFLFILVPFAVAGSVSKFYVSETRLEKYKNDYGEQATKRLTSLLTFMDGLAGSSEDTIIIGVNRFFNQLEYQLDIKTWGKTDYWASRLEFLGKGQGDCEDFAVAKFLTMMQLGISEKKLFLTYVKAIGYPEAAHLVVTFYKEPGTIPLVLDNYKKVVLPATDRTDLIPVYSFTANDLFLQKQQGLGKRINRKKLKTQKNLESIDLEIQVRIKNK